MKCPVCKCEIAIGERLVRVKVPVEGVMRERQAHATCVEHERSARTTIQRS